MDSKKGQIAIEALALIGIVLALVLPILLLLLSQANSRAQDLSISQARASVQKISQTAFEVYAQGAGARKTVSINFPQNLLDVRIGAAEITFVLERDGIGQEIVAPCNARIKDLAGRELSGMARTGRFIEPGMRSVTIEYGDSDNSVGIGYAG